MAKSNLACHLIENSVNYTYRGFTNNSISLSLITGIASGKHYLLPGISIY
jgi:hypothetical protein